MKKITLLLLLTLSLSAKNITPSDVYSQVMVLTDEVHYLLKYYGIEHDHEGIIKRTTVSTKLKPRNTWQVTYEILVKINILRNEHGLPTIEPVNIAPILNLEPYLVYEQTQRILSELEIFMRRENIVHHEHIKRVPEVKTTIDVYNALTHMSYAFDELNAERFTLSYVLGEQMRLYDDITQLLLELNITDNTIPKKKNIDATNEDVLKESIKVLEKIKQLQIGVGIDFVDFTDFNKENVSPGEIYTLTQMILAELQTIKAYVGIKTITPSASVNQSDTTAAEVEQLVSWNLRKLNLIHSLRQGK